MMRSFATDSTPTCLIRSYNGFSFSIQILRRKNKMGLFGFGKKPDKNVPVLSADEVRQRLLILNRDSAPYQIIDGTSEKVDLIAEWKIVDAKWYEIFAKSGLTKVFRI